MTRQNRIWLYCLALLTTLAQVPASAATVEEQRLNRANNALPQVLAPLMGWVATSAPSIVQTSQASTNGTALWHLAKAHLHHATLDDRPLYWARLASQLAGRQHCKESDCTTALHAFEYASRGMQDVQFAPDTDVRILVTGFDPFALDRDITQANPSGVVALQLDGYRWQHDNRRYEFQTVIFPVRYADFDAGAVEALLQPLLEANRLHAVFTLSMGREDFDLERFPGRRRATIAPDNLKHHSGASPTAPIIPLLNGKPLPGPEFVEFSLPVAALQRLQSPYAVNDNRQVTTLETGELNAVSLDQLRDKTAVAGSGGSYLSNEISYRSVRLAQALASQIPVGHIHLPRIRGFDPAALNDIAMQTQQLLQAGAQAAGNAATDYQKEPQ